MRLNRESPKLRSGKASSLDTSVSLIYSSRSAEEIIFKRSIEDWAGRYSERVNIHHALSQAAETVEIPGATLSKGRVNKLLTRKLIKMAVNDPLSGIHYFICGPSGLMKMYNEMLEAMQVPQERICLEWFAPEPPETGIELPEQPQEVLLHFYEQSNLLEVTGGKSILAAALDDKIPLPYSCKAGTCGMCAARLTSGKVTMVNNFALRKADLDGGLILLCQSYPVTGDVTVEID